MNLSAPFIERPVATTLLTVAIALTGMAAYSALPIAALPQVDFPTITVAAGLPGASAEIMASSVATPLERQLGHIAGVTEMTSTSALGTTAITLQFDLSRDINGAARDVQAAIQAARSYLPSNLPANPSYRKVNPADAPIMVIALTSDIYDSGQMYDAASTIIQQRLSQLPGVGQVIVGGASLPAVRVSVNLTLLQSFGLGISDVAAMLSAQNSNTPKGFFDNGQTTWEVLANDQLLEAADYRPLLVGYHNGTAVRLEDVASVTDSVQNVRSSGYLNGKPSVPLIIFRAPGANIIDTVQAIRDALPALAASIPRAIDMTIVLDRTDTIRASIFDVEMTLIVSVCLVIAVVFLFLRNPRATLIPSVAVPVSLIGTFGAMYLLGYSLDNLSLMALTISSGFVVDDAIVVIENISRYLELGLSPKEAALRGAREIGFTVLTITTSLVAVFIPLLMMGGIVGRLFREFAVTLSVAIAISMVISLTTTPMLCARLLRREGGVRHGRLSLTAEHAFDALVRAYDRTLTVVLRHPLVTLLTFVLTVAANVYLLGVIPKGFFPQQDNGTVFGGIQGEQDLSFQAMNVITQGFVRHISTDPAVANVIAFTGGNGATNTGFIYMGLKPLNERRISSTQVVNRLRPKLMGQPGASVFLQAGQDVRIGGRQSSAQYQYTVQSESIAALNEWGPRLLEGMRRLHGFTDVNSDQQIHGLQAELTYDRPSASRFGITPQLLDRTLYSAFGQSLASTLYTLLNQYYVVLEAAPNFTQHPSSLNDVWLHAPNGSMVPLNAVSQLNLQTAPLSVNHQGLLPAVTISFNLAPGISLSQATAAIDAMERELGLPKTVRGTYSGTLQAFQASLGSEPLLILTALLAVYIVLGILYESFVHPLTILSTIPSATIGAALMLMLFGIDLSIVALIGMILLIGIVKKNAILMIDFAIVAEREEKISARDAVHKACLLRFRPILMTTMAALFGAMPLAFGTGMGAELRRPLGVTIIGGLLFSQLLTLYSTPVIYLYLDRVRAWFARSRRDAVAGSG